MTSFVLLQFCCLIFSSEMSGLYSDMCINRGCWWNYIEVEGSGCAVRGEGRWPVTLQPAGWEESGIRKGVGVCDS